MDPESSRVLSARVPLVANGVFEVVDFFFFTGDFSRSSCVATGSESAIL
jgi:hypothetical protein